MDESETAGEECGCGTAILLFGMMGRSLRFTAGDLVTNLLEPLRTLGPVDVTYHSWETDHIMNPRAGEHGVAMTKGDYGEWLEGAHGISESQDEFDFTIDWMAALRRAHPDGRGMREADATLMNLRRAVESMARVWKFFEERGKGKYARVIVTRPDLRFFEQLPVPAELLQAGPDRAGKLWVPRFQSWGGVNDRFAIGRREDIGIWCNRADYTDGWILGGAKGNSERVLSRWLQQRGIRVEPLEFAFQRVRSTGEIAKYDKALAPPADAPAVPPDAKLVPGRVTSAAGKPQRFLILARESGVLAENLKCVLGSLGKVEVIVDREGGDGIYYDDAQCAGFGGLMSTSGAFPSITAWSRAFYHLSLTLGEEDVWFVEDDVGGDIVSFMGLVSATCASGAEFAAFDIRRKAQDLRWPHWRYAEPYFKDPVRCFKPLSRKSARLIRDALEFRATHGGFTFHEVLFSSLARRSGLLCLDWNQDEQSKACLGVFRYRPPVTEALRGVSHPVKQIEVHTKICEGSSPVAMASGPGEETRRMAAAGFSPTSLQPEEYRYIEHTFRRQGFKKAVSFGTGPADAAILGSGCKLLSYESESGAFKAAERQAEHDPAWMVERWEQGSGRNGGIAIQADIVVACGPLTRFPPSGRREVTRAGLAAGCPVLLHEIRNRETDLILEDCARMGYPCVRIETTMGICIVFPDEEHARHFQDQEGWGGTGYRTSRESSWVLDELALWQAWFTAAVDGVKTLDIGGGDGLGACLMLGRLFTHPLSSVHLIDDVGDSANRAGSALLAANIALSEHPDRIFVYEGLAPEVLAWMISGDEHWETFDFANIESWNSPGEMISKACFAWHLLRPGGVMTIHRRGPGGACGLRGGDELTLFKEVFAGCYQPLFETGYLAVKKVASLPGADMAESGRRGSLL